MNQKQPSKKNPNKKPTKQKPKKQLTKSQIKKTLQHPTDPRPLPSTAAKQNQINKSCNTSLVSHTYSSINKLLIFRIESRPGASILSYYVELHAAFRML